MIYSDSSSVRLRAVEREDLPRFVAWLNDPEVREHLLINLPLSNVQEERWFEHMLQQPQVEQPMVIEVQDGEAWKPIGNTAFHGIDWVNRHAEVGICVGDKSEWNNGYGRETMRIMLRVGFETLNLNRVYLRVFEDNMRGIKAYERAGFKHEGRQRQAVYKNGRYCDILMMSVLQEEWNRR